MAEFLSVDELNLDFESIEKARKNKGNSFCGSTESDLTPSSIGKKQISNRQQSNSTCHGRQTEKPCTTAKSSESTAIEDSSTKRKASLTGLKIMDRVGTSLDRERKVWMGQNDIDTRRRSYTAITSENLTKFDDKKPQLLTTRKTSVPAETSGVSDIFEDGPLEKQGFDSLFVESNQLAW